MMLSSSSNTSRLCINPYQNSRRGNQNEPSPLGRILASLVAATQGGASSSSSYTRQQWAQLHKALKECADQWQFSHAVTLLEWVMKQMENRGNEQHVVRSLDLLATALHEYWGIHLVYAVACPSEENSESRLCFLGQLSRDFSRPPVQSAACLCLASLWRALSQLDVLASPSNTLQRQEGNTWWIKSFEKSSSFENENGAIGYWTNVIEWSLAQWFCVETDDDAEDDERSEVEQDIIEKEALKYAASVLLVQFLDNESTSSWLYSMSEGKWLALTERLIEQSQRLLDPNMPMTLFARLSLVSLHLLAVMERKAAREMPHTYEKMLTGNGNGGLVMGMVQSTLQVNAGDSSPRWAVDGTTWVLSILQEWSRTGALTPYWEMDTRSEVARTFAKEVVERVRDGGLVKPANLASFLWLLRETPALCWNVISHMVPKGRWLDFVEALVALVLREKTGSSVAPACVLRQILLLSQRRQIDPMTPKNAPSFIERLISRASSALECQEDKPLLLSLLDSLKVLSSSYGCGSSPKLNNFVEKLISTIYPAMQQEMSRTVTRFDSDLSMDSEECTPPVNNLSRLDVSAIMPDASQEPVGTPVIFGLESCIRIAAANFLAVLVNFETERESREFQSQTTQVLSEFLLSEDMVAPTDSILLASSSAVLRRGSLLRDIATMEDGSHFMDVFISLELNRTQAFQQSNAEAVRLRKRVAWLEKREKQLSKENNALECQIKVQNTSTQRERTHLHRKLVNEANETLKAEMAQRVALQTEVEDLHAHAKDIRDKLQTSESQKQSLQESEQRLKQDLGEKCEALQTLEKKFEGIKRERDEDRERVARLSKEVESANVAISSYKKRESQLRDQIAQNEEDLEGLEASRAEMHANLESLFGDMVGLAHAYELKEKEVSNGKESKESTIEKLEKDLDKERQKRKDLEDKYRQVEYENEALSRKYARAREKLEEERKQRSQAFASQASSRRGDTSKSYIQQLQLSTSRNTSHSSSRSGKENEPRSMRGGSKIR